VTPLGAFKLPDGGCIFTAEGGQRWSAAVIKRVGSRVTCSGQAEASFAVAPEDLTSAIRRADGTWLYVGETGALYEAGEPLGAFTRTVPAPEPLAKVAGVGSSVLAATLEGKLLRWDAAKGWHAPPPSPVLTGARVFDLAAGAGKVLALAYPEALFASEDDGVTWKVAGAPTVGARRLGSTASGELGAQGIFESLVWQGSAFLRGPEKLLGPAASLAVEVGRAPSVAAVQSGRAVLDGDRYYEVVRPDNEGETWLLSRGRFEGRLETAPLADSARCASIRLGARAKVLVIACVFMDGADIVAELRRSNDAGTTWGEPLRLATPDTDQIAIAVSPHGTAMVTGVCRSSDASGACKPSAPILAKEARGADAGHDEGAPHTPNAGPAGHDGGAGPAQPALRALPSSAPQLSGAALAPVFGSDGRSAYFLGKRGKDDRTSLFVSHDGGETFSPRLLQPSVVARPQRRAESEEEAPEPDSPESFEIDENTPPHPGDDGTIGLMVLRSRGSYAYVTTDDDGRVLQMAAPPVDEEGNPADVILAGHGRRVLAIPSYLSSDGTSGSLWESLDGGANWDRQAMPQALLREYSRGNIALVCGAAGCMMGDTVTRVGWGGGGETGAPERPTELSPDAARGVLTPIVCDLSASTKWSRIDEILVPENNSSPIPNAHVFMRGRSAWSAVTLDRATGALAIVSATLPESGEGEARIVRRPLLGPRGQHTATHASASQVEGYAVVRVPYPADAQGQPKLGAPLRNVEIAWENFFEGTSAHARIPDAGPLEKNDIVVTGGSADLRPSMISISSHGLFVRVHASHGKIGDEIFVDPAGRVERYKSAPWPSAGPLGPLDFRPDASSTGGELLGIGLLQDPDREWSAVALAKRAPGGWTYAAHGLLPQRTGTSLVAHTTWGWSAKAPVGVLTLVADPPHGRAWAQFVGFRGDGTFFPAQPVPTSLDLGERPRACTPADRSGTPRAAMPFKTRGGGAVLFPGARHPVLVFEPRAKNAVGVADPQLLVTSAAVIHGTPASPCLAAFQADSAVRGQLIGALIPGDPARSWLFRAGYDARATNKREAVAPPSLEYRPMACRYDPNARIPEAVWTQEGTSRP
jgi:hypothetical protein